jgi:hypothetical protein
MSVLTDIRTAIRDLLVADRTLAGIAILTEDKGDIQNEIERALGVLTDSQGMLGVCVVVMTPTARCSAPDAPGPLLEPISVVVDVIELVIVNRGDTGSKIPASDIAEQVLWRVTSVNHPTRGDDPAYRPISVGMVPDETYVVYRCEFETSGVLPGITTEEA